MRRSPKIQMLPLAECVKSYRAGKYLKCQNTIISVQTDDGGRTHNFRLRKATRYHCATPACDLCQPDTQVWVLFVAAARQYGRQVTHRSSDPDPNLFFLLTRLSLPSSHPKSKIMAPTLWTTPAQWSGRAVSLLMLSATAAAIATISITSADAPALADPRRPHAPKDRV